METRSYSPNPVPSTFLPRNDETIQRARTLLDSLKTENPLINVDNLEMVGIQVFLEDFTNSLKDNSSLTQLMLANSETTVAELAKFVSGDENFTLPKSIDDVLGASSLAGTRSTNHPRIGSSNNSQGLGHSRG